MKRILACLSVALFAFNVGAATLVPIQLLNPTGSALGQSLISTGISTPPAWIASTLPAITAFDPLCGTGTHDCKSAIDSALAAGKGGVMFPPGIYYDSGNHTISANGFEFLGSGQSTYGVGSFTGAGTLIVETTAANPFLTIAASATWVGIKHFTVTRNATATAGGNGIVFAGDTEFSQIDDVLVDSQFTGASLNTTTFSTINRLIVQNSRADGLDMTDSAVNGTAQWQIDHLIAGNNVGRGINVSGVSGSAGMILGAWQDIQTFANTGGGIGVSGLSGAPTFDLRINGCFLGSDGNNSEIGLSYNQNVMISHCFIERAGLDATGPGGSTAASNKGNGISVDSNSSAVMVKNSYINTNAYNGIFSSASNLTLDGVDITNNGQALSTGNQAGVVINAGNASITAVRSGNAGGNTSQLYGIANAGTIDLLGDVTLQSNTTANYNGTAPTSTGAVTAAATTAYTPTVTASSGTFTAASATGHYYLVGKFVFFEMTISITTVGTASGTVLATLPFATNSSGGGVTFAGQETSLTGKTLQGLTAAGVTSTAIRNYDVSSPIAAGATLVLSGVYVSN